MAGRGVADEQQTPLHIQLQRFSRKQAFPFQSLSWALDALPLTLSSSSLTRWQKRQVWARLQGPKSAQKGSYTRSASRCTQMEAGGAVVSVIGCCRQWKYRRPGMISAASRRSSAPYASMAAAAPRRARGQRWGGVRGSDPNVQGWWLALQGIRWRGLLVSIPARVEGVAPQSEAATPAGRVPRAGLRHTLARGIEHTDIDGPAWALARPKPRMTSMSGAQINRCLALGRPFVPHDHPPNA